MSFEFNCGLIWLYRLTLALLFLVQLHNCIIKWTDPSGITISTKQQLNELEMPDITVCKRGFKGLSDEIWQGQMVPALSLYCPAQNDSQAQLQCMNDLVYEKKDFFRGIFRARLRELGAANTEGKLEDYNLLQKVRITPLHIFGLRTNQCFTISFNLSVEAGLIKDGMILWMKPGVYTFSVHHHTEIPANLEGQNQGKYANVMFDFGQSNESLFNIVSLSMKSDQTRNIKGQECNEDFNYSPGQCLKGYFLKEVGCQMEWNRWNNFPEYPVCTDPKKLFNPGMYYNDAQTLADLSGCLPRCLAYSYVAKIVSMETEFEPDQKNFNFPRGFWVNFAFLGNIQMATLEVKMYDFNSFLGEAGGSLGLFLGLNLISMETMVMTLMHMVKRKLNRS